jgi:Asp-tRNA(Asn)/Glu-tRNA(Gln) amidotransferase A subunit family amidase
MSEIAFAPASKLLHLLNQRKLGSRELLELYLARIARFNGKVNAVVYLDRRFRNGGRLQRPAVLGGAQHLAVAAGNHNSDRFG